MTMANSKPNNQDGEHGMIQNDPLKCWLLGCLFFRYWLYHIVIECVTNVFQNVGLVVKRIIRRPEQCQKDFAEFPAYGISRAVREHQRIGLVESTI